MNHSITFAPVDGDRYTYVKTTDTEFVRNKIYYYRDESGAWHSYSVNSLDPEAQIFTNTYPIPTDKDYYEKVTVESKGIEKNSYDDWHLVSQVRPSFVPPTQKTKYVEIPGASTTLDLSESVTGYSVFNNREGSFDFLIENDHQPWYQLYSEIMEFLHGRRLRAVLDDDRGYYYEGRFSVGSYSAGDSASSPWSKLNISYNVDPYKWAVASSTDDWLWDPFNFYTGIILAPDFKNIAISASELSKEYNSKLLGIAPFCPEFIVETTTKLGATLRLVNESLGIDIEKDVPDGTTVLYDFVFYGDVKLYFKAKSGTGTLSINFRQGRL